MNNYAVRRILSLWHTYEALPYNAEFVTRSILPVIHAEIQAQLQSNWYLGIVDWHRLEYDLFSEWRERIARQDLTMIQDFKVAVPEGYGRPLKLSWSLLMSPGRPISMEFNTEPLSEHERDWVLTVAYERLSKLTSYARSLK